MAVVHGSPDAAGMGRRSGGRQRQWGEISHESEEQEQFGGQSMHAFLVNQKPKMRPE
jgi:hypothetical protein